MVNNQSGNFQDDEKTAEIRKCAKSAEVLLPVFHFQLNKRDEE